MEFVPMVVLGSIVWKFVDLLKNSRARDWNAVVTQVIVWVAGVGAVLLFAGTAFGGDVSVMGDVSLNDLGLREQIIVGLSLTSLMSVGYDFKKALDASDSAKLPTLTKLSRNK